MRLLALAFLTVSFLITSCGVVDPRPKSPEQLKAELKQMELMSPSEYISSKDVTLQKQTKKVRNGGLFREAKYEDDGAIISGAFTNTSTLARYKDLQVEIKYYSKTKTLIETKNYTLFEYLEPNSTREFSMKVDPPSAYKSFGFRVLGAKGVYE